MNKLIGYLIVAGAAYLLYEEFKKAKENRIKFKIVQ